jgi:TRAP transporter TAXI family solute receptor
VTLVIATAEQGNTFHTQGLALADLMRERGYGEDLRVTTSTGSVANAELIGTGEAQFGFMAANWVPLAIAGHDPFKRPIDLAMVSPVNTGPMFFVVQKSSPIRTFSDLRGRRVAVGYKDSGMARHVATIFDALGWTLGDIDPAFLNQADGGIALAEGRVDAQFQPPLPNTHFTDLIKHAEVRVVPFAQDELATILAKTPVYGRVTMRAGTFRGHDRDVETFGVQNVLVSSKRVSDERVYAVARLFATDAQALAERNPLYESLPSIIASAKAKGISVLQPGGVALHAAARRAFNDAGISA